MRTDDANACDGQGDVGGGGQGGVGDDARIEGGSDTTAATQDVVEYVARDPREPEV